MRPPASFACAVLLAHIALAEEKPKPAAVPQPAATKADEPLLKTWSPVKAAEYLDGVGVNWTRDRKCFTCHTNMPYVMARPLLPGDAWKEVRSFAETQSSNWEKGENPRRPVFVVVNAFVLAFNDAQTTRKLHPQTKYALDRMWDDQLPTGEWAWLKCDWPPMEHDDFYGSTLAALAAALAPEGYARTPKARAGLAKLKAYFAKNPAPDLHHKVMLLWVSRKLDGVLSPEEQQKTVTELKAQQHADGGWALPAMGTYKRRDGTMNAPTAPSDGYATGLAVYVMLQAGVPATDGAIVKGVTWLKSNQRESGRWFTRSVSNDKAHYITNAGTAFAVMALTTAGEKVAGR